MFNCMVLNCRTPYHGAFVDILLSHLRLIIAFNFFEQQMICRYKAYMKAIISVWGHFFLKFRFANIVLKFL